MGIRAIFIPFMYYSLSLLKNSNRVLATTEVGTCKGVLVFAIRRSVFVLTSQLLPVPVHCLLHSELGWLGCRFCALCRIALISISNYSFYFFQTHEFISRDMRFISILCPASERMKRQKVPFRPNLFSDKHFNAGVCNPFSPRL